MKSKYRLRQRKVNISGYNTGLIEKLKQKKFQRQASIVLVLFIFFQLLSPFGSLLGKEFASASSLAISTYSPAKDGHMTTVSDNIVLTFNQAIEWPYYTLEPAPGAPIITVDRVSPYGSVATFTGSRPSSGSGPSGITISGSTLTIDLPNDLTLGTQYSVEIGPGTICEYGNYDLMDASTCFGGIYGASNYYFTVGSGSVAPTVTAPTATNITNNSAVLGADVSSSGGATITSRGVAWSTTANPTTSNTKAIATGETGVFTVNATGLIPGTRYYYRAFATNSVGTTYGANMYFDTTGTAPTVSITAFDLPSTSDSLIVPFTTFTTTGSVSHYFITESTNSIAYDASGWVSVKPTSYNFTSSGTKTLYAWVKTGSSQSEVFGPVSDTVNIASGATTFGFSSLTPSNNATGVSLLPTISITFDENVIFGNMGNINNTIQVRDSITDSSAAAWQNWGTITGSTWTTTLTNNLSYSKSYYVYIGSETFKNAGGAYFSGISDKNVWKFTTMADPTPPPSVVVPTINTQPANQTVTSPSTATFSVSASNGGGTLSYQWQSTPTGSTTFSNITGATSASYTTPATSTSDSGKQYKVVVTNSAGSVTSNTATLTVNASSSTKEVTTSNKSSNVSKVGGAVIFNFGNTSDTKVGSGFNVTASEINRTNAPTGKSILRAFDLTTDQADKTGYNATIALSYPTGQTYKSGDKVMYWDTTSNSWSENGITNIPGTVGASTITFNTTHFTEFAILTDSSSTVTPTNGTASPIGNNGTTTVGGILPTAGSTALNMFLNFILAMGGYLLLQRYLKRSKYAAFVR